MIARYIIAALFIMIPLPATAGESTYREFMRDSRLCIMISALIENLNQNENLDILSMSPDDYEIKNYERIFDVTAGKIAAAQLIAENEENEQAIEIFNEGIRIQPDRFQILLNAVHANDPNRNRILITDQFSKCTDVGPESFHNMLRSLAN